MITSTRWPRSTPARSATRTAVRARCASPSRSCPRRSRAWDERTPARAPPARMIQVDAISKSYAGQTIFHELSWRIPPRERIGLVGPNGAGKTTLCRLLAGVEDPDDGRISRPRGTSVGYLPQEAGAGAEGSVLGEALAGFGDVWKVEREMEEVAAQLAVAGGAGAVDRIHRSEALTARYGDLQHRFEALGGYRLESEAKAILSGLGFRPADFARPLPEFSGGSRGR